MTGRFDGRTAIITGASRGIGLGIAERLVAEGAQVIITGRQAEALDAAQAKLGGAAHAIAVPGRADDPERQAATVATALDAFGRLDVLVNNAGINPVFGPLVETDLQGGAQDRRGQLHCGLVTDPARISVVVV
jgi:NAD(P)-dependent dehydrogenase (short-subunit alcohol dehydrogenase family)